MVIIETSIEICSTIDKVWEVVSDLDNEPKFWKGTKEVNNISKSGNKINREITIAFRDQKCLQEIDLFPKDKIEIIFTKGIINGTKIITLTPRNEKIDLGVKWDIKLSGMMSMFTGIITKHIKSGTEQALKKIKEEIEK